MTYDKLIDDLLLEFSLLKDTYIDEGDYIEGLPHLCFEIVFAPYVRQTCVTDNADEISKISSFMENMAISKDEKIQEVLAVSVLEPILADRKTIEVLKQYSKAHTLELLYMLEREYGWLLPEPSPHETATV
jgi:hypothetical protein